MLIKAFVWICLVGGEPADCFGAGSPDTFKVEEQAKCLEYLDEQRSAMFALFQEKGLRVTIEGFCAPFDANGQPIKGLPL